MHVNALWAADKLQAQLQHGLHGEHRPAQQHRRRSRHLAPVNDDRYKDTVLANAAAAALLNLILEHVIVVHNTVVGQTQKVPFAANGITHDLGLVEQCLGVLDQLFFVAAAGPLRQEAVHKIDVALRPRLGFLVRGNQARTQIRWRRRDTAAVTLCSSFLPAAGVAAAPYLHPASPSYGYYGPNTFQDPTKWNGDHVLAGGMQEWAAEDAAQHALNLANWRIKLLQAKLEQAKLASQVMNVGDEQTNYLLARKQVAQPAELQLKAMKRQLVSLVGTTSKEIHALTERAAQQGQRASRHPRRSTVLRTRSSKHSHESYKSKLEALKKSTDKKLADILAQIDKISN